ncbi:MAG: hypothetical protein DRP01_00170 [Archaeoglobales archaeon]|nr:MAG: hypothetical protein DRP01_00170 [Archaeoglobales archaeon]
MTDKEFEHKKTLLSQVEKHPLVSKKFMAWLIQQLLMTGMAVTALIKQPEMGWQLSAFMVGIVFMMGVSTMWFMGKQAAADIAVRGFALVGNVATAPTKIKDLLPQDKEDE